MKKLMFILVISFSCTFGTVAQKYDTYYCQYLEKSYDISILKEKSAAYKVYINTATLDGLVTECIMVFMERANYNFLQNLISAKEKYIEWLNVVKNKNITEVEKTMEIYPDPVCVSFKYGDDWHASCSVLLSFRFKKIKNHQNPILIIETDRVIASDNKYITCEPFIIPLSSLDEINALISKLSDDSIQKYLNDLKSKEDLFK
ncbi:MAG: hypothetical protein ACOYN4_10045 [Bacteroidales bacterium]